MPIANLFLVGFKKSYPVTSKQSKMGLEDPKIFADKTNET